MVSGIISGRVAGPTRSYRILVTHHSLGGSVVSEIDGARG